MSQLKSSLFRSELNSWRNRIISEILSFGDYVFTDRIMMRRNMWIVSIQDGKPVIKMDVPEKTLVYEWDKILPDKLLKVLSELE